MVTERSSRQKKRSRPPWIVSASNCFDRHPQLNDMVLVGIRTGGVFLAERLKEKILQKGGIDLPTGIIDIALYRDDWTRLSQTPEVKKTEIRFPIEDKHVLLVDDVLFTGRTIRAALDALLDLGRPRRVELAVLIDRGHRELPICADYVGSILETSKTGFDQCGAERIGRGRSGHHRIRKIS